MSTTNSQPLPPGHHLAAISPSKGALLTLTHRPTPTPGPTELLIEVHSIALNPIDHYQRDYAFPPIAAYPAILGSDISGIVLSSGTSVPPDAPKPGTRVCAYAPSFFVQAKPDYGAFQTRVLVPAVNAMELPEAMGYNEAAILPMAVQTVWSGWYSIGLAQETKILPGDRRGMLVWGGASSVGSAAVQIANLMGFRVYVTASEKHHQYLKSLGASEVFDYKSERVVEDIVSAAKEDGLTFDVGFDAVGSLKECEEVLVKLKGEGPAKLASATPLSENSPKMKGVEVTFVAGPSDEKERMEHFHFIFNVWLKEKLESGEFVPSPHIKMVEGGLAGLNKGLDELKKGVSGTKLVVEV